MWELMWECIATGYKTALMILRNGDAQSSQKQAHGFDGAGGTQRLARLVGPSRAKELIFTAGRISADEALAWGVVHSVVSSEQLLPTAHALAATIAHHSPLAVAYAKAAVDVGAESSLEQGLRYKTAAIRATLASDDYRVGLAALAAREQPQFALLNGQQVV